MTDTDLLIPRLYKMSTLFVALSTMACASTREYDQAARNAARVCNVSESNLVLTSNRDVDQRRFWLVARRTAVTHAQFDCIDKWSVKNFSAHAELTSSLPPRGLSKAEYERQADIIANQMVAKGASPHP